MNKLMYVYYPDFLWYLMDNTETVVLFFPFFGNS